MLTIKTKTLLAIALLFLGFFWSGEARATVIFQDDFESDPGDWICRDSESSVYPWNDLRNWYGSHMSCGWTSGFDAEWKMGPGRNGGNAVYSWKKSGVPNGYRSESTKWFYSNDIKTEIYHRWYMKVPPANEFNKYIEHGFKFHRYITRENGYVQPPEIYLNVLGWGHAGGNNTFAGGMLGILARGGVYHASTFLG
jgi:hypothetical protein